MSFADFVGRGNVLDVKKHVLYQLNRTDIFDHMPSARATARRFETLNGRASTTLDDFKTACAVEMLDNALKHGLTALFEVGIPIFQISEAIRRLVRCGHIVTKGDQQKLLDDCDAFSNWVRENYTTGLDMMRLTHDTFHRLNELYRTIKELPTEEETANE